MPLRPSRSQLSIFQRVRRRSMESSTAPISPYPNDASKRPTAQHRTAREFCFGLFENDYSCHHSLMATQFGAIGPIE